MKILMLTFRPYPFASSYADSIRFDKVKQLLEELGHEVTVVAKNQELKYGFKDGIYLIPSFKKRFLGELVLFLLAPYYLRKTTKKYKPDVVYSYSIFYARYLKSLRKHDFKVHLDVLGIEHREKQKSLASHILTKILRHYEISQMRRADLITTVNEAHAKVIRTLCNTKVLILRDAVDSKYLGFSPSNGTKNPSIVFVGSIANRRLDDLFAALPTLTKNIADLTISIIGDGADLPYYKQLAQSDGWPIKFTGYLPHKDVFSEIKKATFCFSDDWSQIGFPVKVFEYMALGKVSIVQDTPATREIITDGESGILYKNATDLASKTSDLIKNQNLMNQIAKNAYDKVKSKHTWEKRRSELEIIYKSL